MGARVIGVDIAKQIVDQFLTAKFQAEHPNHSRRVDQLFKLVKKLSKLCFNENRKKKSRFKGLY